MNTNRKWGIIHFLLSMMFWFMTGVAVRQLHDQKSIASLFIAIIACRWALFDLWMALWYGKSSKG